MENVATIPLEEAIVIKEYVKLGTVEEFRKLKEGCSVIIINNYPYNPYRLTEVVPRDEGIQLLSDELGEIKAEKFNLEKTIELYKKRDEERNYKTIQPTFIQRLWYLFTKEL